MRFSEVQEDEYGMGLGNDRLPENNNVDYSMMAATGEVVDEQVCENIVDDSSMIYNLPLLFANGYPTSLDKISLPQLEKFITFMVQCSLGHDTAQVVNKPSWWPNEVHFSTPFVRPSKVGQNWMTSLKKLVFSCYTYHKSEYLLRFCSSLAQYPKDKIYYVNNWDSTTSLYHKSTGKLLATFRNENMEYDKVIESPRKLLLHKNNVNANSSAKNKKVQQKKRRESPSSLVFIQPQTEEIYLCDNCDAEFGDLEQMKDHEKKCGESIPSNNVSRPFTPCEPIVEPVSSQKQFLEYFQLLTSDEPHKATPKTVEDIKIEYEPTRSTRRQRTATNLTRFPTIPFSSPAGLAIAKKSKAMTEATLQERLDRNERHMGAPILTKSSRPKWFDRCPQYSRWNVTYKPNKDVLASADSYIHEYTFGARKYKSSLSIRSQLLYVACQPCHVRLERLTDEKLNDLKLHPWKYRPPVRKITPKNRPRTSTKIRQAPDVGLKRSITTTPTTATPTDPCPAKQAKIVTSHLKNKRRPNFRSRTTQNVITPPARIEKSDTIVIVDLCSSSDEEEATDEPILADENRDPLFASVNGIRSNFLKNPVFQSSKLRPNSLGFSSEPSNNDGLRDNVLTIDNDRCSINKRLSTGVKDTSIKSFAPIFKSTP